MNNQRSNRPNNPSLTDPSKSSESQITLGKPPRKAGNSPTSISLGIKLEIGGLLATERCLIGYRTKQQLKKNLYFDSVRVQSQLPLRQLSKRDAIVSTLHLRSEK